jgi:hypothetical protein
LASFDNHDQETGIPYDIKELRPEINFIDDFNKECSYIQNTSVNDSNFMDEHKKDDLILCIANLDLSGVQQGKAGIKIALPKKNYKSVAIDQKLDDINSKLKRIKKYLSIIVAMGIIIMSVLLLFKFNML